MVNNGLSSVFNVCNREMLGSKISLRTKQKRIFTLLFDHRRDMGNCTCTLELPEKFSGSFLVLFAESPQMLD